MTKQQKNQILIAAIFGLSIIPFLMAWIFSANASWLKTGVHHGKLITPVITTEIKDFSGYDAFSQQNLGELQKHWLLVNVIPTAHCRQICLDALLKTRQLRLMLNKDLARTRRVAIVFDDAPPETSRQWWLKDAMLWRLRPKDKQDDAALFQHLQQEENPLDETVLARVTENVDSDWALRSDLIRVKPAAELKAKLQRIGPIADGMLLLMDPLGNLMMQYQPGFDPYQVKSDLLHLLKVSQIG